MATIAQENLENQSSYTSSDEESLQQNNNNNRSKLSLSKDEQHSTSILSHDGYASENRVQPFKWAFCGVFLAYVIAACIMMHKKDRFNDVVCLIILWILYLVRRLAVTFRRQIKGFFEKGLGPLKAKVDSNPAVRKYSIWVILAVFVVVYLLYTGLCIVRPLNEPSRLVGVGGLACIYVLGFVFSKHRKQIRARPLVGSLILQSVIGLLVMRTDWGFKSVKWLSAVSTSYLGCIKAGSQFVFGSDVVAVYADTTGGEPTLYKPDNELLFFATMVVPVVIYVGATTSVLYYLKLLQPFIKGVGWAFGKIAGTTIAESVNAAANIFLGMTEAPLVVKPFIADMTHSEIHAVCTGGFATVSGSVMGAYIAMGVSSGLLITSIVMSSAGSLGMAKLLWPETEILAKDPKSKGILKAKVRATLNRNQGYLNVIEAAADGASQAIPLALNIGAMLIAFLSLIKLMDIFLTWAFAHIDVHGPHGNGVTIEILLGYLFYPIAYVIGITSKSSETMNVARLLGVKLMATEMTAFSQLSGIQGNTNRCAGLKVQADGSFVNFDFPKCPPNVMNASCCSDNPDNLLGTKATTIASFALCGFGNFGSVGIMIGGLVPLAPHKRSYVTSVVTRALLAGLLTNLVVACLAGLAYDPDKTF